MAPDEIEAERQARLERNRICARECRQRKKNRDTELAREVQRLEGRCAAYERELARLKRELAQLKGE